MLMIKRLLDGWRNETKATRYSLVTLFAIGTGVRLFFLFQPIMQDEAANYMYFAAKPLSFGLSHYPEPSNHLLNTFLMHWVTRILGNGVWAVRLPAFISGILLIPVIYLLIRRLYNRNTALLATALVVVAP
jgi:predicted membrane-bound mannosyltransferase